MDWLIHNPIADIHGPAFLLVYGVIAVAVIAVAYRLVRSHDKTGLREPPPVPATLDPYEIAYLRGGKYAVIRTVIYALHQLGLVEVVPRKWLTPTQLVAKADAHPARPLTELEERVLATLRSPVPPLSQNQRLASDVVNLCRPYRNRLESEQLLRSEAVRASERMIPFFASAFLVALTLYKIAIAAGERRPFLFLLFMTVVALIVLWKTVGRLAAAHASARGRAYLKRLQDAYRDMPPTPTAATGTSSQPDMLSVALVGLFGIGILSGTTDAAFASLFPANRSRGGSGCGGGGCGGGGCGG